MTALADLLSPADRKRLLERMAELAELDRLVREPAENQPLTPPALRPARLAAENTTTERTT